MAVDGIVKVVVRYARHVQELQSDYQVSFDLLEHPRLNLMVRKAGA